jgi:uncharacterized protein (TIGR03118 family)
MAIHRTTSWLAATAVGLALGLCAAPVQAETHFVVKRLVSDGFLPAPTTDPSLINPWGMAAGPGGPIWVSDNGTGLLTIYNSSGGKLGLVVNVAKPAGQTNPASPTGQVHNGDNTKFLVDSGNPTSGASFIVATEDGTISGWNFGVDPNNTFIKVDNSNGGAGAVYKGLAIGSNASGDEFIYASNFRSGNVEMYNSQWTDVLNFTDTTVDPGYAPFNVQDLNGHLYVTFALQDAAKHDDVAGAGNGYVDEFNLDGTFVQRIVSQGGPINSPWGLAFAPASFGTFAGDLLVGNFGDGTIAAFNPVSNAFVGDLTKPNGQPITLGDLWGLKAGEGGLGGTTDQLFFTAGIKDEAHGLFGMIAPAAVPETSTWIMMTVGMGLLGGALRSTRSKRAVAAA